MKNKMFLIILLLAGMLQGCEDLNENAKGLISSESFYADAVSLQAGIVGVHRDFATAYYQTPLWILTNGDDVLTTRDGSNKQPYRDYDQFQANGAQEQEYTFCWNPAWVAIRSANSYIESVEKNRKNISMPEAQINQRIAEAKFMRANMYFLLVRIWGDVPYFETALMQDSTTRRMDKRVVYTQIIKDLEYAEQNCVDTREAPGQVTKWGAKATLAQVYMQLTGWPYNEADKWTKVKQYCTDIIGSGKFELMDNYGDLFKYTKFASNKENIFSLTFGLAATRTWQRVYGKPWNDWNDMHCQWRFFSDFPEGARKSFSLQANMKMAPYINFTHPCFSKFLFGTIKFDPQGKNDSEYTNAYENTWQTSNNIALERMANIYLMWAEADANINSSVSATAIEYLNMVKRRGKGDINNLGVKFYTKQMEGVDVAASDFTNNQEFKKAIIAERGWEFAGEWGYRWFDLVRTKTLGEVTAQRNNYDLDAAIKASLDAWKLKNPSATQAQIDAQIVTLKFQASELPLTDPNPTVEKYGFAPIPQVAVQTAPGLKEPPLTSFEK